MFPFIYLASQSPRRSQLLTQIGVRHELLLPAADENAEALEAERAGEAPAAYVRRVTRLKLRAAVQRLHARGLPPAPVLCADTTVALGRQIYGKPENPAHAARMLAELAGTRHSVLTAVSLWAGPGQPERHALSRSSVRLAPPHRRRNRRLHRHRRTPGQSRRLRHPGPRRRLHRPHQRQPQRHHGPAPV